VRIAPRAWGADRIETEFLNQSDPEAFVFWGTPEQL